MWLLIVLLLADIGSIAWLVAGRPWAGAPARSRTATDARFPQYERPGRHVAVNPDDDEAFLRQVQARADALRASYEARPGRPDPLTPGRRACMSSTDRGGRRRPAAISG